MSRGPSRLFSGPGREPDAFRPPQLAEAKLAIDAFAALVEGLEGRLGEAEPQLRDGLAQLRMAFVQIRGASGSAPAGGTNGGGEDGDA